MAGLLESVTKRQLWPDCVPFLPRHATFNHQRSSWWGYLSETVRVGKTSMTPYNGRQYSAALGIAARLRPFTLFSRQLLHRYWFHGCPDLLTVTPPIPDSQPPWHHEIGLHSPSQTGYQILLSYEQLSLQHSTHATILTRQNPMRPAH